MTVLHAHFHLRDQHASRAALQRDSSDRAQHGAGPATSGGKSWNKSSPLSSYDVNARDWLGRTVLHLACAATDPPALEYVRILLAQPAINLNLCDTESHWTALHRALYNGNVPAALLLLQRPDLDTSIKDLEGYTAFDVYNSTIDHTKPCSEGKPNAELFTWGANRNATLCLGDGNDRTYPDQVPLMRQDLSQQSSISDRFIPLHARQVAMSKLHTAVVTSEKQGNIRLCGFSSGGRLGPGQHTQYNLEPPYQFTQTVSSVALGQDHTLLLTTAGEVYSWGLNRFSQLGYVVEPVAHRKMQEPIQTSPRKILGVLRKDINVLGVAACKTASACWTSQGVFTWGTNNGQLGYDKAAQPVQILPRKVTKLDQPVTSLVLTDYGMACLLKSQDVMLFWNDRHFKINFPSQAFPAEITVYRPPQATGDVRVVKITSSDDNMAALSSNGELFTFSVPDPSGVDTTTTKDRVIKASKVWALRKQFSAVKDAALGTDGSLIICTESGHVFVRSRNPKGSASSSSGKVFKFQRIPYVQRVIGVCANSTGAFGALRVDFKTDPIQIQGNTFAQDIASIQPYLLEARFNRCVHSDQDVTQISEMVAFPADLDEDIEDDDVRRDIDAVHLLCQVLLQQHKPRHGFTTQQLPGAYGADIIAEIGNRPYSFPCHKFILSARCEILHRILTPPHKRNEKYDHGTGISVEHRSSSSSDSPPRLIFRGCQPMTVLIFLSYLYTDDVYAVWDRRITGAVAWHLQNLNVSSDEIRLDLQRLSHALQMPVLSHTLQSHVKTPPTCTMAQDMEKVFAGAQKQHTTDTSATRPDVVLELKDKDVLCHSAVLRARSPLFFDFFGDKDWTLNRRSPDSIVRVNLKHLNWKVMEFVLKFLCCGQEEEMFSVLEFIESLDDLLTFLLDIISAANELLLTRLVQIASAIVLRFLNTSNACFILSDAEHFNAQQLTRNVMEYIMVNLELFLENRLLDDLSPALTRKLSEYIRQEQASKSPQSRGSKMAMAAIEKHADWLALQDIPLPVVGSSRQIRRKESAKLSPTAKLNRLASFDALPSSSPTLRPQRAVRTQPSSDDIFFMEDPETPSQLPLDTKQRSSGPALSKAPSQGWKEVNSMTTKVDMKQIMAEAAKESSSNNTPRAEGTRNSPLRTSNMSSARGLIRHETDIFSERSKAVSASPSISSSRTQTRPWNLPTTPTRSISSSLGPSPGTAGIDPPMIAGHGSPSSKMKAPLASGSPSGSRISSTQATLGPIYTPTKQRSTQTQASPSLHHTPRAVWGVPPTEPVASSSKVTSGFSLVAIQQAQIEESIVPKASKQSLVEIQAEERARQEEADFLKWWEEEERRVRLETEAAVRTEEKDKGPSRRRGPARNRKPRLDRITTDKKSAKAVSNASHA